MQVYHDLNQLPEFRNAVITIGSFDGVHKGHQKLLEQLRLLARRSQGESVVITFHPHPRLVVYPNDDSLRLLNTIDEKLALLEQYGVNHAVVVPFTVEFAQQPADEYVLRFLVERFHPRYVVIGYDHRFGLNRQGDINYLRYHGKEAGFEVVEISRQDIDAMAVSSTKIRKALDAGEVERAARLLGHAYRLTGKVVYGQQLGARIGFPTANLEIAQKHKLVPREGIYAVYVTHKEQRYRGMLYIGNRPTLNEDKLSQSIEVNIFDFEKSLYGDKIQIELVAFLREDAQFDSLEALSQQLALDKKKALQVLPPANEALRLARESAKWPDVAVVILNYNTRDLLERFLPSVLRTDYPNLRVVVADNGSSDDSVAWLRANYPEVECLPMETNHGFAEGYNRALTFVEAPFYVLLNSDVEVDANWLKPLIRAFQENDSLGAAQPKILDQLHRDRFEYAGAAGGWIDTLGYPFCRGRIFQAIETDRGQYDATVPVFWASGAALCIRAPLFQQLGGFDSSFFAHLEEIDLCWRVQRAGYEVQAIPASVVYHVGGGTLAYGSSRKTYLNFRNSLYMLLKNESGARLFWVIPSRLLLDGVAALMFLSQRNFGHIGAISRAHWHFFAHARQYWRRRRVDTDRIQKISIKAEPEIKGRYPGSILVAHYIKRIKHFKNLRI